MTSSNFSYGFPTPGQQNPTGTQVMEQLFFLSEDQWVQAREKERFDYIVIGSGFCALAFATQILKQNKKAKILLLERGPFFLPEHCQALPLPFQHAIGGLSETFPWTLSSTTVHKNQYIKWQHGMVPFFGGRSTSWSGWCPEPTAADMASWPKETIAAAHKYFPQARDLINIVPSDQIGDCRHNAVFGTLQCEIKNLLDAAIVKNSCVTDSVTRCTYAPLAVRDPHPQGLDFIKFSTVGPLLTVASENPEQIKIVTNCVVNRILHQNAVATALQTSRGVVSVGDAKVILAMGSLPPTTLVLNSFPALPNIGKRFTAHFISSIIARIPMDSFAFSEKLHKQKLELGAIYVAGVDPNYRESQFHIQLTALYDPDPDTNADVAFRYMPDVVATASREQLQTSAGKYVVLVCAVLGETDHRNTESWMKKIEAVDGVSDATSNVVLQVMESDKDLQLWDAMDDTTFKLLEGLSEKVQYWHSDSSQWKAERPPGGSVRVPGLVHEGSTLHIGDSHVDPLAPVDLDYKLKGVDNVYVTGAGLWPKSGSWNPTLTMVALTQHLADQLEQAAK